MNQFFSLNIEFDHDMVESVIQEHINEDKKGFVCIVDGNIVAVAHRDSEYRKMVNKAIVNLCDGSYIAFFYGLLKRQKVKPYIGGDLFIKMIEEREFKHLFLGTTLETLDALKGRLQNIDPKIASADFLPLPFTPVEEFDYPGIARDVDALSPDLIWVSLGAPKQEKFMYYLLPHLNKGVMVGIGAVFNFQSGIKNLGRAPDIILKLKLEWLYRLFREPKKQWQKNKAFLKAIPPLLIAEIRRK